MTFAMALANLVRAASPHMHLVHCGQVSLVECLRLVLPRCYQLADHRRGQADPVPRNPPTQARSRSWTGRTGTTVQHLGDLQGSSSPRAFTSATIADAAACSGDSCRPSPSIFFCGLTTVDWQRSMSSTLGAHPTGSQPACRVENTAPGTVPDHAGLGRHPLHGADSKARTPSVPPFLAARVSWRPQ